MQFDRRHGRTESICILSLRNAVPRKPWFSSYGLWVGFFSPSPPIIVTTALAVDSQRELLQILGVATLAAVLAARPVPGRDVASRCVRGGRRAIGQRDACGFAVGEGSMSIRFVHRALPELAALHGTASASVAIG